MKIQKIVVGWFVFIVFALVPTFGVAQISPDADKIVPTEYSGLNQDEIHIFCGKKGEKNASLTATVPNGESGNFEWLKYNEISRNFDPFPGALSGNTTSTISNLDDGCYRVNITSTSNVKSTFTAWVFNNYIRAKAEVTESDCNSFTLKGTLNSPLTISYVDLPTGQPKTMLKDIKYLWTGGEIGEKNVITYKVFDPPARNTDYTFKITDKFGCVFDTIIQYISIVTEASFTYTEQKQFNLPTNTKEAPLTVTFNNTSDNADAGKYEWFIFRDIDEIKQEAAANPGKVIDSIMVKIYSDNPDYVFEKPGSYKVKLVSKKISLEFNTTCTDTFYSEKYIVIKESFIDAPNFFTPDGKGNNEEFVVQFVSMKSVKISIFNRWGKVMHVWENNNIQGFGGSTEGSVPQSVWDGKVGGKMATPGVYYYVAEGIGRDDKRQRANGFFHLFREK